MSRARPATTGYERLAQAEQLSDSDEDDIGFGAGDAAAALADANPRYATANGVQPRPVHGMTSSGNDRRAGHPDYPRRRRANSGVDLKAINARLERWADEIAAKFMPNKKQRGQDEERLEIHYSVFHPPEGMRCLSAEALARTAAFGPDATGVPDSVIPESEFDSIVDSVRTAIRQGTHPTMISQGSSGSYFARNTAGKVVGVFKPKDEEPYATGNPKWNKWIHRNLFPCFFGRACLIPNLSYVSEAAAYVLDNQLRTYMVPYTDVVYLSSKAFHYPFWDRYSHSRNRKPLPAKPGSFQVFLKGFKDANLFLREHPWPDQYLSGFRTSDRNRSGRQRRWADSCRPTARGGKGSSSRSRRGTGSGSASGGGGGDGDDSGEYSDYDDGSAPEPVLSPDNFMWTETLKQSFREELEKLVILDYIMRNTDRGLDNWMIKVDWSAQEVSIASEPMQLNMDSATPKPGQEGGEQAPRPVDLSGRPAGTSAPYPSYRAPQPMDATTPTAGQGKVPHPSIHIGAIDNSLSWPWKHPDAWRSFPFGWLFLPVDLIGRPFSQKTRDHFLPLLTSPAWWSQTQAALRRIFQMDPDFQERMFAKQIAVMKGQAWNVVETLKTPDHGPLELTRRAKVCVWDDLVEVPIAVPMRATSSEIRRRNEFEIARAMQEEMDIGATGGVDGGNSAGKGIAIANKNTQAGGGAGSSEAGNAFFDSLDEYGGASDDLLIRATSPLPNPGRFELTKESVAEEDEESGEIGEASSSGGGGGGGAAAAAAAGGASKPTSPGASPGALHAHPPPHRHQRRYSYTTAASRRASNSIAQQLYGERHGGAGAGAGGNTMSSSYYVPPSGGPGPAAGQNGPYRDGPRHHRAASLDNYFGGSVDNGDDVEGDLGYAAAEGMENNRRRVIVERLEPVKTKNPVFTWC